ncbi:MAG: hypothetical protein HY689_07490 [Chloroflexi bacterium]|nr:hypothetical protein [Chloroflexota bacterium]
MPEDLSPKAHTKHGDLTLDQIGEIQPGMARLMLEISERYWIVYYAAQAENWELARHELSELRKTMQIAQLVRPKYQETLTQFDADYLKPLLDAVRAQDWPAFNAAYRRGVDGANEYHHTFGYGYIEWQLPDVAPPHLRLAARRPAQEGSA